MMFQAFGPLRRNDPDFFRRVSLLEGDLEKTGLGLRKEDEEKLLKEVDCIFHCGLITKLDEKLRRVSLVNVRATRDLLSLAKQMKELSVNNKISVCW